MITTRRKDAVVAETVAVAGEATDAAAAAAAAETVAVLAGEATSFGDGAAFACAGGGAVCCGRGRVGHDDGTAEADTVASGDRDGGPGG